MDSAALSRRGILVINEYAVWSPSSMVFLSWVVALLGNIGTADLFLAELKLCFMQPSTC